MTTEDAGKERKNEMEHKPTAKERVAGRIRSAAGVEALEERVAELEAELVEYRSAHVRFAELIDVVTELLVPMAQADRDRIDDAIERYTDQLDQES